MTLNSTIFPHGADPHANGPQLKSGASMVGSTVGGVVGATASAALLGLPGELIGGWVGGELVENAGAVLEFAKSISNQAYHTNFGGRFQDSEAACVQGTLHETERHVRKAKSFHLSFS